MRNGNLMPERKRDWRVPVLCIVLATITFAVFEQTLRHDFVNFDDDEYIYANTMVARGLTLKGIVWTFSFHACNWHPLTWLSHMLDCQVYGLHPWGHHLTNIILHTATVIALFLLLRQMTGSLWRSAFVAAIFAIHPLRVESVAWIAERKDLLSGLFFMLTIAAYVRFARHSRSPARYALVLLLFALGLMCKPMLVTVPLVLLLLDYWPLKRQESAKNLIMEKLPLLMLSAAASTATIIAQTSALHSGGLFSIPNRLENALMSCITYLRQMVWPSNLAVLYPYPQHGYPLLEVALAGLLLVAISIAAWILRRSHPWLLVGWGWYLVMLLPVLGLIQQGSQAHADRFTYLPQIGIYLAVTWMIAAWRLNRVVLEGLMIGTLAALMVCAWQQTAYWQDSETLWTHTISCTLANDVPHFNLGVVLRQKGRVNEAITQYQIALQINPADSDAHYNLGIAFLQKGMLDEAIAQYQIVVKFNPSNADAHSNLAIALQQKGKMAEAVSHYEQALQIDPANAKVQNNLAWLLATCSNASIRNGPKAVELARQANETSGGKDPVILDTLAAALAEDGRFSDAKSTAQKAIDLAQASGQKALVKELNGELKRYEAGLPCRE